MTRPTKRAIENSLDELESDDTPDVDVFSSVVVVDDDGVTQEPEPPKGHTFGDTIPTQSPVVECNELHPTDD